MEPTTKDMLASLERGETTGEALVREALNRIRSRDPSLGAFLSVDEDGALATARSVDRRRAAGEPLGPLAGIPVAVKDNIHVKGQVTSCASKFLENFKAPYDATVIEKLKAADAVFLGKTNMDEFAMGSSTEFSAFHPTRNPANPEHVPGGSSGGSTAAVAAGLAPLALGSSTGGSIRQPAAFCGVVGFKPTYGRVSRYGLVAFGSSLDQIGTIAQDVDGAARLYQVIAGNDPRDSTSADREAEPVVPNLEVPPAGLKIGLAPELEIEGLGPEIASVRNRLLQLLEEAGATSVQCPLPHTDYAISAYYLIATAEASSNLARFDGARYGRRAEAVSSLKDMYVRSRSEGFGIEVKRRILLGTYCLSSGYYEGYYLNAQRVRTKIIQDFQKAFAKADVLLAPTTPTTAFKLGEKTGDPMAMYLSDIFTVTANLAGIPAISIPCGTDKNGLPIGMQLMANHFEEAKLFRIARHAERLLARSETGNRE